MTPVFKSGKKAEISNYRPISILCAMSKIFEKIVATKVLNQIQHLICLSQHGFVKNRSTESNLLKYLTIIKEWVKNGGQVDSIYTDFSKAFDKVSHRILLRKLKSFGIRNTLLNWFESYLQNRSQFVLIGGFKSARMVPTSGVPQGSILGPLLFILFINDLPDILKSNCLLFADDSKLFRKINDVADCYQLQNDVNDLTKWCTLNKLSLNVEKCAAITFSNKTNVIHHPYSINNEAIKRVTLVKDLGVWFDVKLTFNHHIKKITRKAYQMLGFIFRSSSHFTKRKSLVRLYDTYVRSRLEYCSSVWYYDKYITIVERVQKKFVRMLYFKFCYQQSNYVEHLAQLGISSLESRRIIHDEIFCSK